jgi:2,4-dienoyl-CoA reductase-like NADH-dependent reductase (Old Yellow Enzyme family)
MNSIFEPYHHGNLHLKNRILKSGIYEGRCDAYGFPGQAYTDFYESFARMQVGGLITGFAFVSREGRAMQPRQAGIDHPDKISFYQKMTDAVHKYDCPVFLQISHAGRQTLRKSTGFDLRGPSSIRSVYFRQKPVPFVTGEIYERIEQYALAAQYAKKAGFDGIQLHAAHGYLIHQFILPAINDRKDEFGLNKCTGIGTAFLEKIISSVRDKCGADFPALVKISGAVDLLPPFSEKQFVNLIRFLDSVNVSAIEISYGTMDHALNIFRGDIPEELILSHNPILQTRNGVKRIVNRAIMKQYFIKKLKPFAPVYNLEYASLAKKYTRIPVISVGGFRSAGEITESIEGGKTDLVGLARPFICEPDFIEKIKLNGSYKSKCLNCNYCSVMCDSDKETRCYKFN